MGTKIPTSVRIVTNHTAHDTDSRSNRVAASIINVFASRKTSKEVDATYLKTEINSALCLTKLGSNLDPKIKTKSKHVRGF